MSDKGFKSNIENSENSIIRKKSHLKNEPKIWTDISSEIYRGQISKSLGETQIKTTMRHNPTLARMAEIIKANSIKCW